MRPPKIQYMTTEKKDFKWGSDRLWYRIATVAGVFAVLIAVLIIGNYIQYKKADPVNMAVINSLVERLHENPADSLLREEIRTLDLLSRKAYFTSQWQIRTGGYLVLALVGIVIISLQIVEYRKKINPVLLPTQVDDTLIQNRKARRWIVAGGSTILVIAAVFGLLSADDISARLNKNIAGEVSSLEQTLASGEISIIDLAVEDTGSDDSTEVAAEADSGTASAPASAAAPSAPSDNYPNFRGNAGLVSKRNIPVSWNGITGNNLVWKTKIPLFGQSSPVIWGENLYVTGSSPEKQEVYCFDVANGQLKWTGRVGNGTKKPRVNEETGYAAPTPVADASGVYAIFATGDIAGFDHSGRKLWEKDLGLPDNAYGHASSLMIYNGNVIVQYDQRSSQKIIALSAKTGDQVWNANRNVSTSWASPILINSGNRMELLVVAEPYIASYDPSTGKELWKIESIGGEVGPSAAYANGIVFAVNDYSILSAIRTGTQPAVIWTNDMFLSDIPSPVANDKYLFLATSYGTLVCFDALNGEIYWEKDLGEPIYSSPVIAENRLYVTNVSGKTHVIAADREYLLIAESQLGERVAATPAFTNGRIYIRGVDHIYCFGNDK